MDQYDVIWDTPSADSSGSMPLGNGEIGINVWVEETGDVLLYLSRTDAWSENGRLLKLAGVRVQVSPNPFRSGLPFAQHLHLQTGMIEITGGEADHKVTLRIWVDANNPVVHIESDSKHPHGLKVQLELWRTSEKEIKKEGGYNGEGEIFSAFGMQDGPHRVIQSPDTVVPSEDNVLRWYHRNPSSIWPLTMKLQGLEEWMQNHPDPLLHRTFGGAIKGDGLIAKNDTALRSAAPKKRHVVSIYPSTLATGSIEEWNAGLDQTIQRIEKTEIAQHFARHEQWWREFWDRSWIRVTAAPGYDAQGISRGYVLQRFMNACAGRGNFPIKFNGSLFTVDANYGDEKFDADYRRWGGPYWFQNTRLIYWPMLASGDFDLMEPFFQMYRDTLPLALERTQLSFGHEGAFFPETMYFWGSWENKSFGWDRQGKGKYECASVWVRWYWSGGLELSAMILDGNDFTKDTQFAQLTLPLIKAVVDFYDQHYPRDERGKLKFEPAASLETWHDATNPLPEIAGLRFVLSRLLRLSEEITSARQKADWQRLLDELPPLPMKHNGQTTLLPADRFDSLMNVENPELYAVFPYRLFGVGKPELEIALATYDVRRNKEQPGWQQDSIQAAFLGLADEAARLMAARFLTPPKTGRFPAFWGPNYDWIPDQDHSSVACKALQTMLLQSEEERIVLLPAWPKEWDVEFKLHAPMNTTVECVYRKGMIEKLEVTPAARLKDVIRPESETAAAR